MADGGIETRVDAPVIDEMRRTLEPLLRRLHLLFETRLRDVISGRFAAVAQESQSDGFLMDAARTTTDLRTLLAKISERVGEIAPEAFVADLAGFAAPKVDVSALGKAKLVEVLSSLAYLSLEQFELLFILDPGVWGRKVASKQREKSLSNKDLRPCVIGPGEDSLDDCSISRRLHGVAKKLSFAQIQSLWERLYC